MQDCQPCSFNVACSAADLFFQGHRSIREKLNGSAIRRSTDFSPFFSKVAPQQIMHLDPAHHRGLPLLHFHLLKHPGRLHLTSRMQTGRPTFPVNMPTSPWLISRPFISLLFQISLEEYSLVRSLQQALLKPPCTFYMQSPAYPTSRLICPEQRNTHIQLFKESLTT